MSRKLTIEVDADVSKAKEKLNKAVEEAGEGASAAGERHDGTTAEVAPKTDALERAITRASEGLSELGLRAKDCAAKLSSAAESASRNARKDETANAAAPNDGAEKLGKSLGKAAKGLDDLSERSASSASQIAGVVRSFAGLGVGMAVNYAAKYMERGNARTAVEAGGNAVSAMSVTSGALMSMPMPPQLKAALMLGAGAVGAGKTILDKNEETKAYSKEYEKSEKEYRQGAEWAERLRSLTKVDKTDPTLTGRKELETTDANLAATIERLKTEIAHLAQAETGIKAGISADIGNNALDAADRGKEELAETRRRKEQLETAVRSMTDRREAIADQLAKPAKAVDLSREYFGGNDALTKVGGAFAGGGGTNKVTDEQLGRKADETNRILRGIAAKNGGSTWQ